VNGHLSTFVGPSLVLATLVGIVVVALIGFRASARATRRQMRDGGDTAMLSAALQDALTRLAAQERATSARAVASEQLSTQVFDSLTAGLVVVDARGGVTIANPAACRMLSLGADVAGQPYAELLAPTPPLVSLIEEGLAAQQPIIRRTLSMTIGDRLWHFGVTVSPLEDGESRHGIICLFSDLTPVVELEQQLQLKEALARLGELTGGIAHEFRNGLATIHGYSRLIDLEAIPQRFRPCVEGIRQETDTLGQVVTNFLNFARPEQAMLARVDLEAVVRRVAADLQPELPAGTAIDVRGDFAPIDGDEVMLRQTFVNLIRNAVEACEGASTVPEIVVASRVEPATRIMHVAVSDNGPGIPPADHGRIFRPFFTTRTRGSGLGLSIVQKSVLLHNGSIAVDPSVTSGARFEMSFPAALTS
jgi:signal transduction histidine kinase